MASARSGDRLGPSYPPPLVSPESSSSTGGKLPARKTRPLSNRRAIGSARAAFPHEAWTELHAHSDLRGIEHARDHRPAIVRLGYHDVRVPAVYRRGDPGSPNLPGSVPGSFHPQSRTAAPRAFPRRRSARVAPPRPAPAGGSTPTTIRSNCSGAGARDRSISSRGHSDPSTSAISSPSSSCRPSRVPPYVLIIASTKLSGRLKQGAVARGVAPVDHRRADFLPTSTSSPAPKSASHAPSPNGFGPVTP